MPPFTLAIGITASTSFGALGAASKLAATVNCLMNTHNILEMLFEGLVLEKDPNAMNAPSQ